MKYHDMIKMVFEAEGLDPSDLSRKGNLPITRAMCFKLGRDNTLLSLSLIAKPFYLDHATILHGIRHLENLMQVDKAIAKKFNNYDAMVKRSILNEKMKHVLRPYRPGLLFRYRKIRLSPK